jgi:hypothetical protein
MTNFEKWQKYTEALASPQNYIDWGFLYMISAALQRRVWIPPDWRPCYPNMYVTLVGKPGIGKGQVIRSVSEILSHHKQEDVKPANPVQDPKDQKIVDTMLDIDQRNAEEQEMNGRAKNQPKEKPALIPTAADAVTYEALVQAMSNCIRRINYYEFSDAEQKPMMKVYSHSSMYFCLEEIASLFRKNTESLVNFLVQAYDCGENYEYVTKTQGKDRIRRLCLNFFGGTNPDFMADTFDDKLLSQGYSSRTFYVFAARNRKSVFFLPELTEEQKACKQDLLEHIKKLSTLYGQIKLDAETVKFLEEWYRDMEENPHKRSSKSTKLEAYYSRKNIHVMKVAMAMHFGESTELYIPKKTFVKAIEFLDKEERSMEYALILNGKNPLADTSRRLMEYLKAHKEATFIQMGIEFWDSVDQLQLTNILQFLQDTNQVETDNGKDEITGEPLLIYRVKKMS